MPGENIHILEAMEVAGGACDGIQDQTRGYVMRGGRDPDDESYRADGMYGQYIVVVPKSKAVITVQALDSKKFFDDVWSELVVPFLNKG